MEEKCRSHYWQLLMLLEKDAQLSAPHYLRQWDKLAKCDVVFDIKKEREDIEAETGREAMMRIRDFKETEEDQNRALQTMTNYSEWHKTRLLQALTWKQYLGFYTFHKAHNLLAMLGLVSTSLAGLRGAHRFYMAMRRKPSPPALPE